MSHISCSRKRLPARPSQIGWGVVFLAAALTGCGQAAATRGDDVPQVVNIAVAEGISGSPDVGLAEVWRAQAFEGLTNQGNDGRAQPKLAEAWSVSPDGLQWSISLRRGVVWHDGTPFDAQSAAAAITRVLGNRRLTGLHPGLHDVESIQPDGNTLRVSLRQPSAFLVDDLYLRLQKPGSGEIAYGTGPYIPTSVTPTRVEMRAHEKYYEGTPRVPKLLLVSKPTTRQAWADLLRGEVDALWNVSGGATEFLNGDDIDARSFPRRYVYVMAFNSTRPSLSNPTVRRALNSAIDRHTLIETALAGRGKPAWSPVWPEHWAYDDGTSPFSFDPSLARAALAAAGFRPTDRRLRISCMVPEGIEVIERLALSLQQSLNDVGVDLVFESVSLTEMEERLNAGRFDAVMLDLLSGPALSRIYSFWHSRGKEPSLNVFGYKDNDVDQALDTLRRKGDEASVRVATSQLQVGFAKSPPGLFLAWSERTRAINRSIEAPGTPGRDPFQPLWQWKLRRPGRAS